MSLQALAHVAADCAAVGDTRSASASAFSALPCFFSVLITFALPPHLSLYRRLNGDHEGVRKGEERLAGYLRVSLAFLSSFLSLSSQERRGHHGGGDVSDKEGAEVVEEVLDRMES